MMPGKTMIFLRLPLFILGLFTFFIMLRYFESADFFKVGIIAAYALMVAGDLCTWVASVIALRKGFRGQAECLRIAGIWQVVVLLGAFISHYYFRLVADKGAPDTTQAKLLLGAWLLLIIIGIFMGIGSELALRESGLGRFAEPKRQIRGSLSWTMVGLLLASLVAFNYAGIRFDVTKDWSYLKVTEPSEATKNFLKTLKSDVTVAIFFERDSDVAPYVHEYFNKVAEAEPKVHVQTFDKDMEPVLSEELKVRRNGVVLLVQGQELKKGVKSETLSIGTNLTTAREKIAKLDEEFHASLLKTVADRRTAYFISGHGEMTWKGSGTDPFKQIKKLQSFLIAQNYRVNELSHDQGLSRAVPDDAGIVFLIAPSTPFTEAELESLGRYVDGGGSLFVALDTGINEGGTAGFEGDQKVSDQLNGFLAARGLRYSEVPLANDQSHLTFRRNASDAWFLFTQAYSSHESVTYLSKLDERTPFLVDGSGAVEVLPPVAGWQATETIRSKAGTFNDANRNYAFDAGGSEQRKIYNLAAATEKSAGKKDDGTDAKGRIVLLADATALSDILIVNSPANQVFFVESLNWLRGTPELAGRPESEADVKIQHTKKEDMAIFYGTILGMPALVLLVGFFATRRRKRVRKNVGQAIGNDSGREVSAHAT